MAENPNIIGIVIARMGSERFPGKPLRNIDHRNVLEWVIGRARKSTALSRIVVASTESADDDKIAEAAQTLGIGCFRGSANDVLGRVCSTAERFNTEWIIRLNADNPFTAPEYIDRLIETGLTGDHEYISYRIHKTPVMLTPVGFFTEMISRECCERADKLITDPVEREHVTLGIYTKPETFRVRFIDLPDEYNDPSLRFTLDTREDLLLLQEITGSMGGTAFTAGPAEFISAVKQNREWQERMKEQNRANPKSPAHKRKST